MGRTPLPTLVLLAALAAGCSFGDDTPPAAAPTTTVATTSTAPTTSSSVPTETGPTSAPASTPAVCGLLTPAQVEQAVGADSDSGRASAQGPFKSCEYAVGTGAVHVDTAYERADQLYSLATDRPGLTALSDTGQKAAYDASKGALYLLSGNLFVSIGVPVGAGKLTSSDAVRTALIELAGTVLDNSGS